MFSYFLRFTFLQLCMTMLLFLTSIKIFCNYREGEFDVKRQWDGNVIMCGDAWAQMKWLIHFFIEFSLQIFVLPLKMIFNRVVELSSMEWNSTIVQLFLQFFCLFLPLTAFSTVGFWELSDDGISFEIYTTSNPGFYCVWLSEEKKAWENFKRTSLWPSLRAIKNSPINTFLVRYSAV